MKELSHTSPSENTNNMIAARIRDLCDQDSFFKESSMTVESIQCLGALESARNGMDLLQTVDSVWLSVFNYQSWYYGKLRPAIKTT